MLRASLSPLPFTYTASLPRSRIVEYKVLAHDRRSSQLHGEGLPSRTGDRDWLSCMHRRVNASEANAGSSMQKEKAQVTVYDRPFNRELPEREIPKPLTNPHNPLATVSNSSSHCDTPLPTTATPEQAVKMVSPIFPFITHRYADIALENRYTSLHGRRSGAIKASPPGRLITMASSQGIPRTRRSLTCSYPPSQHLSM